MRDFTSHLNGKIILNPYTGSSFRHRKTMLRSCFNPQDIFPTLLTDDKLWWQTEQQWILGRPSAKTQRHVPYYQTRTQKNTTFWLILNDCLPVRAVGCLLSIFWLERKAGVGASSSAMLNETPLCWCLSEYHLRSLGSYWMVDSLNHEYVMICALVRRQKKELAKQNSGRAGAPLGCVVLVSEVGGNTRVHIWHDLFDFTKWKGHFMGIFLSRFQR